MDPLTMPFSALTKGERARIIAVARETVERFGPGAVMVNIGVEHGCSLHCLRAGADEAVIYGIDLNVTRLIGEPGARLMKGNSNKLWRKFSREVHLLFVDGGHDYRSVKGDLAWLDFIVRGGLAIFHDFHDIHGGKCPWIRGVNVAVSEWAALACWGDCWKAVDRADSMQSYRRL